MTVSYSAELSRKHIFPSMFVKLLKRWRGSIYKLICCDLLIYIFIYYAIKLTFVFLMDDHQKEVFHEVVTYFSEYHNKIPIEVTLSFFVATVVSRWWSKINKMPWPDKTAVFISCLVRGHDEQGRIMRRTVMRYICLAFIMVFRLISPKVIQRFPNYDSLIDVGVLNDNEKKILQSIDDIYPKQPKYWMPIVWATSILTRAREEQRIRDDFALRTLNETINDFQNGCMLCLHFDIICIPLVYTQLVTLMVYSYVITSVIGSQWLDKDHNHVYENVLSYIPIFPVLKFLFYIGWLKVAESLICPYGYDDDDIEINGIIDRNIAVSYIVVDEMHNRHPTLIKDQYWDEIYHMEFPGSSAPPEHSTAYLDQKYLEYQVSDIEKIHIIRHRRRTNSAVSDTGYYDPFDNVKIEKYPQQLQEPLLETVSSAMLSVQECDSNECGFGEYERNDDDLDEFELLRKKRQMERIVNQYQKMQRALENVADVSAEMPTNNKRKLSEIESGEMMSIASDIKIKKESSKDDVRKKKD